MPLRNAGLTVLAALPLRHRRRISLGTFATDSGRISSVRASNLEETDVIDFVRSMGSKIPISVRYRSQSFRSMDIESICQEDALQGRLLARHIRCDRHVRLFGGSIEAAPGHSDNGADFFLLICRSCGTA